METNEKRKWGGARNGAGRKKKYARNVYFSATKEVSDILDRINGNRSDFINECILRSAADKPINESL